MDNGYIEKRLKDKETVFHISDPTKAMAVLVSNGAVVIAAGTYYGSKMIAWPDEDIINKLNGMIKKFDPKSVDIIKMGNNFVSYLTNGKCTDFSECYHSIKDYKKYITVKNQVFGMKTDDIKDDKKFDIDEFTSKLITNNWHIITGQYYRNLKQNLDNIIKLYGICMNLNKTNIRLDFTKNECQNNIENLIGKCKPNI